MSEYMKECQAQNELKSMLKTFMTIFIDGGSQEFRSYCLEYFKLDAVSGIM